MITLRRAGLRLRRSEWPEPTRGRLEIVDWGPEGNSFRRWTRRAELVEVSTGTLRRPLLLLVDPQLLPTSADGALLFSGIELEASDGGKVIREYSQIWMIQPVTLNQNSPAGSA